MYPEISGAARDCFNSKTTSGQKLLKALHETRTTRSSRRKDISEFKKKSYQVQPRYSSSQDISTRDTTTCSSTGDVRRLHFELAGGTLHDKDNEEGSRVEALQLDKKLRHEKMMKTFETLKHQSVEAFKQKTSQLVTTFKADLEIVTNNAVKLLNILESEDLKKLEELEVRNVWEAIENVIKPRISYLHLQLNEQLNSINNARGGQIGSALTALSSQLIDIAYVNKSCIEREIEQEVLNIDHSILEDRQIFSDLLLRIQVDNINKEKAWYEKYLDGYARWRLLRSNHAIELFLQKVESWEPTETLTMLDIFKQIQDLQNHTYKNILCNAKEIGHLLPPNLSTGTVQGWWSKCNYILEDWDASRGDLLKMLEQAGKEVSDEVQKHLVQLKQEMIAYRGLSEEEIVNAIQEKCAPVVEKRDHNSEFAVKMVSRILNFQSEEWWAFMKGINIFESKVAALHEWYQEEKISVKNGLGMALEKCRSEHQEAHSKVKEALQEATAALAICASERSLDNKVAHVCEQLDKIEEGYRDFHVNSIAQLNEYPNRVKILNKEYEEKLLCLLSLQMLPTSHEDSVCKLKEKNSGENLDPVQEVASGELTPAQFQAQDGTVFIEVEDLFCLTMRMQEESNAAEKIVNPEIEPEQKQDGTVDGEANPEANIEPLIDDAAELDSFNLLSIQALPANDIRESLHYIQMTLMLNMKACTVEFEEDAEKFKDEEAAKITEDLDGWLRAHRPLAGHIEENVRQKRAVELICQKRRMQSHLLIQKKAQEKKKAELSELISTERENMGFVLLKLKSYVERIKKCACLRSLDICKRELDSFNYSSKHLNPACERLCTACKDAADELKSINDKFDQQYLKTPEEGGNYSQESIEKCRSRLSSLNSCFDDVVQELLQTVKEMRSSFQEQSEAIFTEIVASIPANARDISFLEQLQTPIETAKSRADQMIRTSTEDAEAITVLLKNLKHLMSTESQAKLPSKLSDLYKLCYQMSSDRSASLKDIAIKAEKRGNGEDSLAHCCTSYHHLSKCCTLLLLLDLVRLKMAKRALALNLEFVHISNIAETAHCSVLAVGFVEAIPIQTQEDNEVIQSSMKDQFAESIKSCLARSRECGAKFYDDFAKARATEITRPHKIPPSLAELIVSIEDTLGGFSEKLTVHVENHTTQLQTQLLELITTINGLPEKTLNLLKTHNILAAQEICTSWFSNADNEQRSIKSHRAQIKDDAHPSLLHISKREKLNVLIDKESKRQDHVNQFLARSATSFCTILQKAASHGTNSIFLAVQTILGILDKLIYPENIPEETGDSSQTGPGDVSIQDDDEDASSTFGVRGEELQSAGAGQIYRKMAWSIEVKVPTLEDLGWTQEYQDMFEADCQPIDGNKKKKKTCILKSLLACSSYKTPTNRKNVYSFSITLNEQVLVVQKTWNFGKDVKALDL